MKKQTATSVSAFLVRTATPLILLFLFVQLMPLAWGQKENAAQSAIAADAKSVETPADCTPTWLAGPVLPNTFVRAVGVYFPANGRFYSMGGRTSDTAGSDATNPLEYNPATNAWTTKAAIFPDNQMNNMACGVLTDAGTPYIYCVGGSAAGATTATSRVFRYNPVTDTISAVAAPWPGNAGGNILPGGFTVAQGKLYILGGFQINVGMITQIWEFTPGTNVWVQKTSVLPVALGYVPATTIGGLIYTGGGSTFTGGTLVDSNSSSVYDPVADIISANPVIPRATGETRALNVGGKMWVLGGGRTAPNPSNEVDIYDPSTHAWTIGAPFAGARRNFPADSDGAAVWLGGGYDVDGLTPMNTMQIYQCSAPTPNSAASRKAHTGFGPFDVNLPLTGTAGIECRTGGGTNDHTIVATFSGAVAVSGAPQAQVTLGTGTIGSGGVGNGGAVIVSGNTVTIPLTSVSNAQTINVRLNGVVSGPTSGNVTIPMSVVLGDTNASGAVSSADTSQTKARSGQVLDATNFRSDVNLNGAVSSADVTIIKANSGTGLP